MISERQVAVKPPRNCELCLHERAVWYCAADDAFLCHACDVSVHSANQVARKHERVCLGTNGVSNHNVIQGAMTRPLWHGGFRRKARTPRIRCKTKPLSEQSEIKKEKRREDPCVPEIGNERGFLVTDKDDSDFNPLVPDFQGSEAGIFVSHDDVDDCFMLNTQLSEDIGEVESILGVEEKQEEKTPCFHVEEMRVDLNFQDENDALDRYFDDEVKPEGEEIKMGVNGIAFADQSLVSCEKDDEKVIAETPEREENGECETDARQRNMFLRLNYEDVMAAWDKHGSLRKPEFEETSNFQLVPPGICFTTGDNVGGTVKKKGSSCSEREARVWRYRDKRKTRLFEKKIRYEVRKLNADKRPRMKGRFVRRSLAADS